MFEVTCFDSNGNSINSFTQWDIDQKIFIDIKDYTSKYSSSSEVHFSNKNREIAEVVTASVSNDVLSVIVPNILLQESSPIFIYVYLIDVNNRSSQKTVLQTKIPVRKRSMPSDYNLDVSDNWVTSDDILYGKKAIANGKMITGNIESLASQTIIPTTIKQFINSGQYLSGTQTILGDSNLIPSNIREGVDIFGVTGTFRLQKDKPSIIPSTSNQIITADPKYDGLSSVTVLGDSDLTPSNIREGVDIFGVTGTFKADDIIIPPKLQDDKPDVTPSTSNQIITADPEYDGLSSVTVLGDPNLIKQNIIKGKSIFGIEGSHSCDAVSVSLQSKTVKPKTTAQTIMPSNGHSGLSFVVVEGMVSYSTSIKIGDYYLNIIEKYDHTIIENSSDDIIISYGNEISFDFNNGIFNIVGSETSSLSSTAISSVDDLSVIKGKYVKIASNDNIAFFVPNEAVFNSTTTNNNTQYQCDNILMYELTL